PVMFATRVIPNRGRSGRIQARVLAESRARRVPPRSSFPAVTFCRLGQATLRISEPRQYKSCRTTSGAVRPRIQSDREDRDTQTEVGVSLNGPRAVAVAAGRPSDSRVCAHCHPKAPQIPEGET